MTNNDLRRVVYFTFALLALMPCIAVGQHDKECDSGVTYIYFSTGMVEIDSVPEVFVDSAGIRTPVRRFDSCLCYQQMVVDTTLRPLLDSLQQWALLAGEDSAMIIWLYFDSTTQDLFRHQRYDTLVNTTYVWKAKQPVYLTEDEMRLLRQLLYPGSGKP